MTNNCTNYLFLKSKVRELKKSISKKTFAVLIFGLFVFSSTSILAQDKSISGVVTDGDLGDPLPGVTVLVKGTTTGAATDFDGNYSLTIPNGSDVLVFSYVGYVTQEINVGNKKTIDVVLKPDLQSLDEVVIIGYGTAKKSDLTGSVVSIGGDDLRKQPVSNIADALTGRLAGVQVTSTEGSPDAEINIRVRGGGSLTQDASPLIIVDGFPVNSMSDISSSDIENISILKDASSTAIYGSRGANGVIIITTKSGKEGKVSANFNMFYGVSKVAKTIDVLNPEDYVKWQYEYALLRNDGDISSYEKYFGLWQDYDQYIGTKGNNWQKQIYGQMGETQSRDLSVRGGSDKISFNFNYAHYDQKSIMVGSDFKRDNLSFSLKNKASDKVNLNLTLRYSNTEVNGGTSAEQTKGATPQDSRFKHAVGYYPIPLTGIGSTDTDEEISSDLVYPFTAVADNQRLKNKKNYNILGSFSWDIIKNSQFKTSLGLDNYNTLDYRFYGKSTYYVKNTPLVENQGAPALITFDKKQERFRNANTFNYDFKDLINENHSLKLLLGEEMIYTKTTEAINTVHGFPDFFDFDTARHLTNQGVPFSVEDSYSPDDKLLSFFGRINYAFNDRYLVTATYRADGSSKFLGSNRWGYFPSAAVAWKINKESFLKDVDWINTLKLRLSYGQAGNNNIPSGKQIQTFEAQTTSYINNVSKYWAASNTLANPDLKWETTVTQNIGLDFDFFKGRISGSVEAYKNVTKDLLIKFPVSGTGYIEQYRNMGETQNTGFEASLNIAAIQEEDYGLNFSFNVGANKNRVNSLGLLEDFQTYSGWASSNISSDYFISAGQPLGQMYGYLNDGRYEVSDFDYDVNTGVYNLKAGVPNDSGIVGNVVNGNPTPGDADIPRPGSLKLKDISGPDGTPDGIVDENDKTVIGDVNPDFSGGFTINAYAYGFDLSAAFNFSVGNDTYNANKVSFTTSRNQYINLSSIMTDGNRWTNLDPSTGTLITDPVQLEALNANTTMWSPYMTKYVLTDWGIEDASFLRLNTLTLGYTVPESIISQVGLSKLRFYLTANNVFIITNYSGLDPEVSTRRSTPLTPGVDYSPYPRSRSLVFGLNLNF